MARQANAEFTSGAPRGRTFDYSDLHWGTDATQEYPLQAVGEAPASQLGVCSAISYATVKKDKAGVWRHPFAPLPPTGSETGPRRGPLLLQAIDPDLDPDRARTTAHETSACPSETMTIGQALDIELADGTRAFLSGCDILTDETGEHVWLGFVADENLAIESRPNGPYVTPHGIEN